MIGGPEREGAGSGDPGAAFRDAAALPLPEAGSAADPGAEAVEAWRRLPVPPDEDEEAVRRMLARAEERLAEPEALRRRESIAHLKAAAAAAADRPDGETAGQDRGRDYRDDLEALRADADPAARSGPAAR